MISIKLKHCLTALSIFILPTVWAGAQSANARVSQVETADSSEVPSGLIQLGLDSQYYSPYAFVVDKTTRTLTVWEQSKESYRQIGSYSVDFGKNDGDKKKRGDHRTPEGMYFMLERLEGPTLNFDLYGKRAFTLDYPNFFDRRDRKTGDGIWLHAVPDTVPLTRGSRGCVVVRNDDILDLSKYVKLQQTPILIYKNVEFSSPEKIGKKRQMITQMIEGWRQAWENKDIEGYIHHYGQAFRSMRMNRDQWKAYKARLNNTYKFVKVRFSRPVIFTYGNRAVVRLLQDYSSDAHSDFGEKRLYLNFSGERYEIVGEDWFPENNPLARQEFEAISTTASSSSNLSAATEN